MEWERGSPAHPSYSDDLMDINTKRDTHVHLHCETLQTICVTDRMVSFTTASGDSLLVHLSREQLQELIREIRRELADSCES